ncbi:GNAT family N-acetyltransferase [Pantoea sp. App145]|uniref:GNAT family N-acetyltransferase n=1 Tax=Pantoea sp. App145 TaxID=3071567 RepID=UPI003A7FA180
MTHGLQLTTPRLICAQIEQQDWAFFHRLLVSPEVQFYVADVKPEEEIRAAFAARLPVWSTQSSHWLCLVVRERETGVRLGVTGYIRQDNDCAEVGFLFAPEAQGNGYARESLQVVCDFAFGAGGIKRLVATVTAGNLPSRRLLEKTGFVLEKEIPESYWLRNTWHSDWLFALPREDYRPSP